MATPPVLISRDPQTTFNELVADYEARTGRTLQPAQVETILLWTWAYYENQLANRIQYAGEQTMVDFADAPALDYLGRLVGVTRLGASAATCKIGFTLVAGHGAVIVPAGTRVSTSDGRAVFATRQSTPVAVGVNVVDIEAEAEAVGTDANGYAVGQVSTILDPLPFVTAAANITVTAGGAEVESDDQLRERIPLAAAAFSNAGSRGAYAYWARSANAGIVDVAVINPSPNGGIVRIFPLMNDGQPTPQQVLDAVELACSAENRRPLCDTVEVVSPTRLDYVLNVELTIYDTADALTVQQAAETALQAFVDERRTKLGKDVIDTQIHRAAQVDGVYRVELPAWSNIIVQPTEFPYCTSLSVSVVGSTAG